VVLIESSKEMVKVLALTRGAMYFSFPLDPNTNGVLYNLLHVPSITISLISVSRFAHDNNVFCLVKSQES